MPPELKDAVAWIGAAWCLMKPWRKRLVRRVFPDLARGLDWLEQWLRENEAL